jgi:signal peptidase I
MVMMSILAAWRRHRQWRHAKAEAKQMVGEAKRILKKKRYRIPEYVATTVTAAVEAVVAARKGDDFERMRQAITELDARMDEHLAFARKSSARQYAESIGLALGVALLLRAFVVEAFQIPSGSMLPTLEVGDHIFVSKFAYAVGIPFTNTKIARLGAPKRGDIIVFKYPPDQNVDYIKRVVGLPGETIEIRRNELFIDGKPMPREIVGGECSTDDGAAADGKGLEARGEDHGHPCETWLEQLGQVRHLTRQDPRLPPTNFPAASELSPSARREPITIPAGSYFVMGDNRDNSRDSRFWGFVPYELIKGRALVVWWSRDPARGGLSPSGVADWFRSIRWRRFFQRVE